MSEKEEKRGEKFHSLSLLASNDSRGASFSLDKDGNDDLKEEGCARGTNNLSYYAIVQSLPLSSCYRWEP